LSWTKSLTTRQTGCLTEDIAAIFLKNEGLIELSRNFNCRVGEIDLIMKDQHTLVFVEVKYRRNNHFGGALAAISASKQIKLQKAANFYLQKQQLNAYNTPCRFDVVGLEGNMTKPQVTWLKNAF